MNKNKILVLATAVISVCVFALAVVLTPERKTQVQQISDLSSLPTMGKKQAPVQMVIFEDLRCQECLRFHLDVFPKIKEKYIDTGDVKCSMVVLSFLENSVPLAVASMAVFEQSSSLFFPFVDKLYHYLQAQSEEVPLEKIVGSLPGINLNSFNAAVKDGQLMQRLDKNEELGKKFMQEDVATPTIFINGVKTKSFSFGVISSTIDNLLNTSER